MQNIDQIPINDLARWADGEIDEILGVVRHICETGTFMLGPQTRSFEVAIGHYLGTNHVVPVANGTDALTLALLSLGVGSGDLVATAANAGGYTTTAAVRIGAKALPIDIDLQTGQMSAASLEQILEQFSDIKAVVVTHLYGLMCDVHAIAELCKRHGVPMVEDCAQAIGARIDNKLAGTFGIVATFSFYPTKNLGALGDGGAVATESAELAKRIRMLAQYGWGSRYITDIPYGFNSRLDEIQAAVLNLRLLRLDADNTRRRRIVAQYQQVLTGGRYMIANDSPSCVAHLAVMRTPSIADDKRILSEGGISTAVHYPVIDSQQVGWKNHIVTTSCPNATAFVDSILTLPCFPSMTDGEVAKVCEVLGALPK